MELKTGSGRLTIGATRQAQHPDEPPRKNISPARRATSTGPFPNRHPRCQLITAKPTRTPISAQPHKRDHHKQRLYRTFLPSKWRAEYRDLSRPPCGLTLALWCETGPATIIIPGVVPVGRLAAAEELGWEPADFDRCFKELTDRGIARADWQARLVFLPGLLLEEDKGPQSASQVIAWRRAFDELPPCVLKGEIEDHVRELLGTRYAKADWLRLWDGDRPSPYKPKTKAEKVTRLAPRGQAAPQPAHKAAPQAAGQTGGQQEQEQEQKEKSTSARAREGSSVPVEGFQNEEHEERAVVGVAPPPPDADPVNQVLDHYAALQRECYPETARPLGHIGPAFRAKVAAIDPQEAHATLDRAKQSKFLTGHDPGSKNFNGIGAGLAWLLDNRERVLAGEFDTRAAARPRLVSSRAQPPTANDAALDVWAELCERMVGTRTNRHNVNQWLKPCALASDSPSALRVEAPDENIRAYVERRYRADLEELLAGLRPGVSLIIDVKGQAAALAS